MQPLGADEPAAIGPYRLLGRLGSGGMGRVYLGRSAGGRTVAVKIVHPHYALDEQFRARFRREVEAARRVGGAWTAPVLDADPEAAVPWVATGYAAGPSLAAAVTDGGPLPARTVRALGAGLAEALTAVHELGLVHRDVKPSNILLTLDGPLLIDFGIARATDGTASLTSTGVSVGSPGYMAPEQILGRTATGAADVFSLGAVLVYAATGLPPFPGDSSAALLYKVVHEEPELGSLGGELREVAVACLAKDPAARPAPAALARGLAPEGAARLVTAGWLPGPLVEQVSRSAVQLLNLEAVGEAPSGPVGFSSPSVPAPSVPAPSVPAPSVPAPSVPAPWGPGGPAPRAPADSNGLAASTGPAASGGFEASTGPAVSGGFEAPTGPTASGGFEASTGPAVSGGFEAPTGPTASGGRPASDSPAASAGPAAPAGDPASASPDAGRFGPAPRMAATEAADAGTTGSGTARGTGAGTEAAGAAVAAAPGAVTESSGAPAGAPTVVPGQRGAVPSPGRVTVSVAAAAGPGESGRGRRVSCTVALAVAGALIGGVVGLGSLLRPWTGGGDDTADGAASKPRPSVTSAPSGSSGASPGPSAAATGPGSDPTGSAPAPSTPGGTGGAVPSRYLGTWEGPATGLGGTLPMGTFRLTVHQAAVGAELGRLRQTDQLGAVCTDVLTLKKVTGTRITATSTGAADNHAGCNPTPHPVELTPAGDRLTYTSDSEAEGNPVARLSRAGQSDG
ncbi:protein kinase [Streptomyces sp. NPDC090108]|uniref:serine/threonine-protein kinase n=1 Tax=Streptomyces sp. NPDC090108 TaxID=3365947 RepID=UPI0038018CB4